MDKRLNAFPVTTAVTSTTAVYVDRGAPITTSEQAEVAVVVQAGATATPAAGVVPKADGGGKLASGFIPAHGAALHTGNVLPGTAQDLGSTYLDADALAAPASPSAGSRRLYVDSGTGKLSVKTSAGAVVSLEEQGGAPSGSAGGDLGSSYPNPQVVATHLASPLPIAQGGTGAGAATGTGSVVLATSPTVTNETVNQAANGNVALTGSRATDTSPTGSFERFKNAAGGSLWDVDINGSLAAGTVPVARVSGLAASATTDTTNAANIASGTVAVSRGGTGTGSTLAGLVRGNSSAMTAAELSGDAVTSGSNAVTVGKINGVSLAGLATGIVKNTTTTGLPSIAVAADFPTLNQNTTGTAAGLSATNDVAHGGTGVATLAAHGVVLGNGAGAIAVTGAGTAGQVLTSNGASADPTFQALGGDLVNVVTSPVALADQTPSIITPLSVTLAVGTYRVEAVIEGTGPTGVNGGLQTHLGGGATVTYVLTGQARGHVVSDLSITSTTEIGDATSDTGLTGGDTYRFFYFAVVKVTTGGTFGVFAARVNLSINNTLLSNGSMIIAHKLS